MNQNQCAVIGEHSPLPWSIKDSHHGPCSIKSIGSHRNIDIAQVWFTDLVEGRANADLIVRAVNAHEALVNVVGWINDRLKDGDTVRIEPASVLAARITDAMENVKGGAT